MLADPSLHLSALRLTILCCIACWILLAALAARAYESLQAEPLAGPAPEVSARPEPWIHLPDVELMDQHGDRIRLRELVAGRRVAMHFITTSCSTMGPPMGALFARLQRALESRSVAERDEIIFLSITLEPSVDTPERLRKWAARFGGSPSWRLLTGSKPVVDELLGSLGIDRSPGAANTPRTLLGDPESGTWFRAHGLARPSRLIEELDRLAPNKSPSNLHKGLIP